MTFTLLPGGGGRPGQVRHRREPISHVAVRQPVHADDATEQVVVAMSLLELSLVVSVLRATKAGACMTLAAELPARRLGHPSMQAADDCNPHGMPRPDGVA